jgi:hypothetical protein
VVGVAELGLVFQGGEYDLLEHVVGGVDIPDDSGRGSRNPQSLA